MTKFPDEVSTRHREEMVCPRCFHEGLEEHPGYIDDYSGNSAILHATRCPNTECKFHRGKGVPTDVIRNQYSPDSFIKNVSRQLDASSILMGIIVLGGLAFLLTNLFGIGIPGIGNPVDVTVKGELTTEQGTPLSNATVSVVNGDRKTTTGPNGSYQLANLSAGTYTVSVSPQSDSKLAASTVVINVSDKGQVSIAESNNQTTYENGELVVRLKNSTTISTNVKSSNGTFALDVSNPINIKRTGGVSLTLSPPPGDTVTDSVEISTGESTTIDIPGTVNSQITQIQSGTTATKQSTSNTWTGSPASISLNGNLQPANLVINVSSDSNIITRKTERKVQHGDSFTQTVRGAGMTDEMTVTLWGGTATAPTTKSGTYSGTNPSLTITEDSAPAQVSVEVTGQHRVKETSATGTIQNGLASIDVKGNLQSQNTTITFTGGTPTDSSLAETTASADGSGGTDETKKTLFTAKSDGTYKINYEFTESRNGDLVEAGYTVDGKLTKVDAGSGTTTLKLTSGEDVGLWIRAEQESYSQDKSYNRDGHEIYVTDQKVSSTQVATGEKVTITATLENQGDPYGTDILFYTDGSVEEKNNEYFKAGERKTLSFTTRFYEEGTHTVSVNEGQQISIQVGDSDPRSGAGDIYGTVSETSDGGIVHVDTDGDGTTDCSVNASDGTCSVDNLSPGPTDIDVTQEGVTDTGFELSYEAQFGIRDVTVDIDGDGVPDLKHNGILPEGETVKGSAQVESGTHGLLFNVENGGNLPYEISYAEPGQVTKPTVYIDGEEVINITDNFRGERSFEVRKLTPGQHTIRVGSSNKSNQFNIRLEWNESGDALYPTLRLNGQDVCQPYQFADDQSCKVESPTESEQDLSLEFIGGASSFDYGLSYTAKATPTTVQLSVDGETHEFTRQTASLNSDGSWYASMTSPVLSGGSNHVQLDTPEVNGLHPPATATLEYTYTAKKPKNPKVIVVNSKGTTNEKSLPSNAISEDGTLTQRVTLNLPASWFTRGRNTIRVSSTNQGIINATATATTESSTALTAK